MSARRVAQTLATSGGAVIVQGRVYWFADSGAVIFENTGLSGVDRRTRQNSPGYGDVNRYTLETRTAQ